MMDIGHFQDYMTLFLECIGVGILSAFIMMIGTSTGRSVLRSWGEFYGAVTYFLVRGGSYENCPYFKDPKERQAKIQIFSLVLIFSLWDKPHYRNGTFQDDMIKNLRNVAVRFKSSLFYEPFCSLSSH